jgi:multicomponent Na+:H+ antiporter subunit G
MSEVISAILILVGSIFIFIATVGMLRMPDLLMRMHAATKAGTLGASLILVGAIFRFHQTNVIIEALLTIIFIFITIPIASHLLARAAYLQGIRLTKTTVVDEFKKQIDKL